MELGIERATLPIRRLLEQIGVNDEDCISGKHVLGWELNYELRASKQARKQLY
jgi:hypothetical protein